MAEPLRIAGLAQGLPAVLRAGGFDLLHVQDGLSGNALARLKRRDPDLPPWLRTVHHLDSFEQPELSAWQSRAWREADAVACVSDTWSRRLQREFGMPVQRVFNGVDLARFQSRPRAGDAALLQALGLPERQRHGAPLCLAHSWARSAAAHEHWYHGVLARRASLPSLPDPLFR